jgi:general secretion pathway protein G
MSRATHNMGRGRGGFQRTPRGGRGGAFTLVEILIVLIILGILATIVIPQFSSASQQARENTLRDDLRFMRTQIGVFKAQHRDTPPGYPGGVITAAPSAADFMAQMTMFSDVNCNTNANGTTVFKFGPYLSKMPANPLNNLDTVLIVANGAAIPAPDDSTGWIYKPQTQEFHANSTGNDLGGVPYFSY